MSTFKWALLTALCSNAHAERDEDCRRYCQSYALACPMIDIASSKGSSAKAVMDTSMDVQLCIAGCLEIDTNGFFDGSPQDFQQANTFQCRMNHIYMQIQEKYLSNTDHCLHSMFKGLQRCAGTDIMAIYNSFMRSLGEHAFWKPFEASFLPNVMRYGLGAVYEGSTRQRLLVSYPYIEVPNPDGRTCENTRFRSVDGTCNSLEMPMMGATQTQFVQTLPPSTPRDDLPKVEDVAEILRRLPNAPVANFNQLCVAWIQFMTHDWFQHDKTTGKNAVTHWWDGSQLYGSTVEEMAAVRLANGKLKLDANDELEYDAASGRPITGFTDNFWVGLHLMHTLFAREHNYVVDQLEIEYPGQYSSDEKFELARLCVSALMAKIHTIEWTPTLLQNPVAAIGLNANWYGSDAAIRPYGPSLLVQLGYALLGKYEVPYAGSGVATRESLYNTTFQMTEEFVAVYRMHPLLPDEVVVDGNRYSLGELTFVDARQVVPVDTTQKLIQGFGKTPSNALSLRNYPSQLYELLIPGVDAPVNLAEIDLLRDRERNLPRYNDMRKKLLLKPYASIDDLTDDDEELALLKSVYDDIDQVDLLVGSLVDKARPAGFAFGIVNFHVFLCMASRRILSDRFLMEAFTPVVYTQWGYDFVQREGFRSVLLRHFPELENEMPENPFMNW